MMHDPPLGIDLSAMLCRSYCDERTLQDAIATTLNEARIPFVREYRLDRHDIVDFYLESGLGLEVKVDGSLSLVTRQLHRYAQHEAITALMLVTTRAHHRNMPSTLNAKRLHVVHLIGGSL